MPSSDIPLGPNSPLRQAPATRKQHPESEAQRLFVQACLGPIGKGPRQAGQGWSKWYPELVLLYAVPNEGRRAGPSAGIRKAEGMLAAVPDLCLPVRRLRFGALYLEFKAEGQRPRPDQLALHAQLIQAGNAVFTVWTPEEALDLTLGYLDLDLAPDVPEPLQLMDSWRNELVARGLRAQRDPRRRRGLSQDRLPDPK